MLTQLSEYEPELVLAQKLIAMVYLNLIEIQKNNPSAQLGVNNLKMYIQLDPQKVRQISAFGGLAGTAAQEMAPIWEDVDVW